MAANARLRWILAAAILAALAVLVFPKVAALFHWSSSDPGETMPVLVADHYIPAFTVIKPSLVHPVEFPKALVPPGALHVEKELFNDNDQMLFTSAIAIPEGQPVTRALMTDASQSDTLGSLIRPGKVAVSFQVDRSHGVGGWIRPGDTVALFGPVPMTVKGQRSFGKMTRLLLSSVAVVAVDAERLGQGRPVENGNTDQEAPLEAVMSKDSKIVTVLVSPADASLIIEAREEGNLSIVLRSLGDDLPWPPIN